MKTELLNQSDSLIELKLNIESKKEVEAFKLAWNSLTIWEIEQLCSHDEKYIKPIVNIWKDTLESIGGVIRNMDIFDNKIKISDDYEAEICDDGAINVGCQHIEFDKLEQLYNLANKTRGES